MAELPSRVWAKLEEIVSLLQRIAEATERVANSAHGGNEIGPFLNSGNTFSVPGTQLRARIYKARSFPAVLVIQAQSTGQAGDTLWLTTEPGSWASGLRTDVGANAPQERIIRMAAHQDLFAFASVAGGSPVTVTINETRG